MQRELAGRRLIGHRWKEEGIKGDTEILSPGERGNGRNRSQRAKKGSLSGDAVIDELISTGPV